MREVVPLRAPLRATVRVGSSKSLAARALVAASLSEGSSAVRGDLGAEDIGILARGLRGLGVAIEIRQGAGGYPHEILVDGIIAGEGFEARGVRLDAGPAGVAARFLTALAALARGPVVVDGSERMRRRPMVPLLAGLARLGCEARSLSPSGGLPIEVAGGGLAGGECRLDGSASSQFLSALLLACTRATGPTTLRADGTIVSRPYVDLTLEVGRAFGLRLDESSPGVFRVLPGPGRGRIFEVEPDASSAGYAFAAAAITGGEVLVPGLSRSSLQPDIRLLDLLERMGCDVEEEPAGVRLRGGSPLRGIEADMRDMPDSVPALAAVALFAEGPTTLFGCGHLRFKESDRLAALARELGRLGAAVREDAGGLELRTGEAAPLRGVEVETYRDHRMAMALALVGLRVPGVRVRDPDCVAKSFPGFWDRVIEPPVASGE